MKAVWQVPVVQQAFPEGTVDPGFTVTISGTLADGTPFAIADVVQGDAATYTVDLQPGTYVGSFSKLGFSCQPSDPFTITAPVQLLLLIPQGDAKATVSLAP